MTDKKVNQHGKPAQIEPIKYLTNKQLCKQLC